MVSTLVNCSYAPTVFRLLDGLFCAYKPPNITINKFKASILQKLADGKLSDFFSTLMIAIKITVLWYV